MCWFETGTTESRLDSRARSNSTFDWTFPLKARHIFLWLEEALRFCSRTRAGLVQVREFSGSSRVTCRDLLEAFRFLRKVSWVWRSENGVKILIPNLWIWPNMYCTVDDQIPNVWIPKNAEFQTQGSSEFGQFNRHLNWTQTNWTSLVCFIYKYFLLIPQMV